LRAEFDQSDLVIPVSLGALQVGDPAAYGV